MEAPPGAQLQGGAPLTHRHIYILGGSVFMQACNCVWVGGQVFWSYFLEKKKCLNNYFESKTV